MIDRTNVTFLNVMMIIIHLRINPGEQKIMQKDLEMYTMKKVAMIPTPSLLLVQ